MNKYCCKKLEQELREGVGFLSSSLDNSIHIRIASFKNNEKLLPFEAEIIKIFSIEYCPFCGKKIND